jgi:hypothetical protein
MNALSPLHAIQVEHPAMSVLRDALGAIAIGPALAYSLARADGEHWQLRRLDQREGKQFEDRDAALAAMRNAVVRSTAYLLIVEGCNGGFDIQSLNWDDRAAAKFGVRP